MSRGNYYYAMGWVRHGTDSWSAGGVDRFEDFFSGICLSIFIVVMGAVAQALSNVINVSLLTTTLPLFNLAIGIIGVVSILTVPKEGILFAAGWTFVSIMLFMSGGIGGWEFLTDSIPIGFLIVSRIVEI